MVSVHKVKCGWCLSGHHEGCVGRHKHYDVWYECPCTTGNCAERNQGTDETSTADGEATESSPSAGGTDAEAGGEAESGVRKPPAKRRGRTAKPKPATGGESDKGVEGTV